MSTHICVVYCQCRQYIQEVAPEGGHSEGGKPMGSRGAEVRREQVGKRQQWILHCIWKLGGQATSQEIVEEINRSYGEAFSVQGINTLLDLITKKGLVSRCGKKGKSFVYATTLTEEEFQTQELERVREVTFNGSFSRLTAALVQNLSAEEREELKRVFEAYERDHPEDL